MATTVTLLKKLASLEEEARESERLWPYPFDAHDVPDSQTLNQMLNDPDSVDHDLRFQMENSVNCLRALKWLNEGEDEPVSESDSELEASFQKVLDFLGKVKGEEVPEIPSMKRPPAYHGRASEFEFWSTKEKTPRLVDGETRYFHNFDSAKVLLVDDGTDSTFKNGEVLYQAVPVSHPDQYPESALDLDQIKVRLQHGEEVILHLKLNYTVSSEQLDGRLGVVCEENEEKVSKGFTEVQAGNPLMPADGAGLGPTEEMVELVAREREIIEEQSASLSDFADYHREIHEQQSQPDGSKADNVIDFAPWLVTQATKFKLAAGTTEKKAIPAIYEVSGFPLKLIVQPFPRDHQVLFHLEAEDEKIKEQLDLFTIELKSEDSLECHFEGGEYMHEVKTNSLPFVLKSPEGKDLQLREAKT